MSKKPIIEKIQKLLSLSHNPNEHEARSSLLKAQALLAKHKLSMVDVSDYHESDDRVKTVISSIGFRKAKWKANLASVIADNFGCHSLITQGNTHRLVFVGMPDDLSVCTIVYEYAHDFIVGKVKKLQNAYRKRKISVNGLENQYAMGFIEGLRQVYEEQVKTDESYALVVQKAPKVTEFVEKITAKKDPVNTSVEYDRAYQDIVREGINDGRNFNITRKIGPGTVQEEVS